MPIQDIIVQMLDTGQRLDSFLAKRTGITRSQIQKFIEKGNIFVNGKTVRQHHKIKSGDLICLNIPEEKTEGLIPEPIPVEILYRDDHIVVANKPAGMVVYPAVGHNQGTLMNALSYHCKKLATIGGPLRPGVVHRLDKDTSGVMVVALRNEAYYDLVKQFKQGTINKRYIALVHGDLIENEGEIALRIGRSESDRKKMSTRIKRGREAVTKWKILERFKKATLIEVRLQTGRTHQIRVHFASIGHPVLGDRTYGKKVEVEYRGKRKVLFPRQMLHAALLGFTHPVIGKYLEFAAPMPEEMARKIEELRLLNSGSSIVIQGQH
jgi:23S rRNA pseudouridine1911/1915/1917 synthase